MATDDVYEIKGDLVTHKKITVQRVVKLSEFVARLERRMPVEIPNIPRTSVAVFWDETDPTNKRFRVLCEIAPGIRSIVKWNRNKTKKLAYRIGLPWTYFWFEASGGTRLGLHVYKCFVSPKQYEDIDSPLYPAEILPNIFTGQNGDICFGTAAAPAGLKLDKQIDYIVNTWYDTEFNSHLEDRQIYPYGATNFGPWVRATEESPTCWLTFPEWEGTLKPRVTSVRKLLPANNARPAFLELDSGIPEIATNATFGKLAEWLDGVSPENRARLKAALDLRALEVTDYIATEITNAEEDGGIVVT